MGKKRETKKGTIRRAGARRGRQEDTTLDQLVRLVPGGAEEMLRALVQDSRQVVVLSDLQGNSVFHNDAYCASLGFEPGEKMDAYGYGRIHPDDIGYLKSCRAEILKNGRVTSEYRMRHKDGRWVYRQANSVLLRDKGGKALAILSIVTDITERKRAEEAMRHSEARYRAIVEDQTELVCRFLPGGVLTFVNGGYTRYFGLKSEDLVGKSFYPFIQERDRKAVRESIECITPHRPLTSREERIVMPDGEIRWQFWVNRGIFDDEGKVIEYQGVGRDITEVKHAEGQRRRLAAELSDRVGELQAVLDAAPVAVWIAHDIEGRRITGNAYADRMIMHTERGANISASAPSGEAAVSYKVFRKGGELKPEEMPAQVAASTGKPVTDVDVELLFEDGRRIHLLMAAVPLFDTQGKVRGSIATGADVTHLKLAEQALRTSERNFRRLFDESPFGAAIVSLEGETLQVNAQMCRMLGYTGEEMTGLKIADLSHPEDRDRSLKEARGLVRGEIDAIRMDKRFMRKDGTAMWGRINVRLMKDDSGRPLYMIPIVEDITERRQAEEALRAGEARYRAIVEDQTELIARFTGDGRMTFVNGAVCRFLGKTEEALRHQSFLEFVVPEERTALVKEILSLSASQPLVWVEHRMTNSEGGVRWLRWCNRAIFDSQGAIAEIQVVGRDVTEERLAEEALRTSEVRYRGIVEDQTEFIGRFKPGGEVTFVNGALARAYGVSPEALVGRDLLSFVAAEDHEETDRVVASLTPEQPVVTFDLRMVMPDGVLRWAQWTTRAIVDDQGRIVEYQGVGRDITKRKAVEEALLASEARYRAVVEGQTDFVGRYAAGGQITFANDALCRYYGKTREQMIGRNFMEFVPQEDGERMKGMMGSLAPGHPVEVMEPPIHMPDGQVRWHHWVHQAICDETGRVIEYQAVGRDVTEIKLAEELMIGKSRLEAAAVLAGGVAHDFNNLMVAVLGNAELLGSKVGEDEDSLEMLTAISKSARRAGDLAGQLLAFARGGKYQPTLVDLNEVVGETLQIQSRAFPPGVRVEKRLAPNLAKIEADRTQMNQVVMNLCLNAVEAMGSRGTLVVSTHCVDVPQEWGEGNVDLKPGRYACVSVTDTGSGMDKETLSRIFEPFFSTKAEGRGLGLPAAYGIIKNHSGDIQVESRPGKGTTVRVCVPEKE